MPSEGAFRDGQDTSYELIETMRFEPGQGFVRLERHLARLYGSAATLGFACQPERVGATLADAVAGATTSRRVRLTLARNGDSTAAAQAFEPVKADAVWKLKLSRVRLSSENPLLMHKTSRREVYVRARAEYMVQQADEVILQNEHGEICEGTLTSLFVDRGDGVLRTPALACGLLAGILRGEMLDEGKAVEDVLTFEQLQVAPRIYVGNSLRGLIPARL